MTRFTSDAARAWLQKVSREHSMDGLVDEGRSLYALSKEPEITEHVFRQELARVCWWDDVMIDEAVSEVVHGKIV